MSGWLLPILALVGGLACPAHMWWSHHRHSPAACGAPTRQPEVTQLDALRGRQHELQDQIAAADRAQKRPAVVTAAASTKPA